MKLLVKGGRVIDPATGTDEVCDVLISEGKIEALGRDIAADGAETVDAKGMIVAPGFVDMHTHLREPGREDEETIRSGTRAAVRGGFTSVACMPNTEPAIDGAASVGAVAAIAARDGACNVFVVGAVTAGRGGKELADLQAMKRAGAVAVSDDGSPIEDPAVMADALKSAHRNALLLMDHCEDSSLSGKGVMNRSFVSTKMGLRGIPAESEYGMVRRDIDLARKAAARIHIAHVSCRESVEIIRRAKKDGVKVTAETAPHYFSLTDECCVTYDTNTKMNPPLRTADDVEAIKEGLSDGTIDAIATDHAPHTDCEKDVEFDFAPFGIIGLETALGLSVIGLVEKKVLSWGGLISKLSQNPAAILGIGRGTLKRGSPADVTIIDPSCAYTYTKESIESKSKNSPFIGWELKGKAVTVIVGGRVVLRKGAIIE